MINFSEVAYYAMWPATGDRKVPPLSTVRHAGRQLNTATMAARTPLAVMVIIAVTIDTICSPLAVMGTGSVSRFTCAQVGFRANLLKPRDGEGVEKWEQPHCCCCVCSFCLALWSRFFLGTCDGMLRNV